MSVRHLPFRKKMALNLYKKYRENEAKLHQLSYIMWECTLRCNLSCLHCGSDCKKDAAVKDIPASDFLNAIDQISDSVEPHDTMIVFTGGEALLRKDIEDVGLELYRRGFPWGIVTNGMLLSENRLDALMKAGMRSITVSLDGLEASHNWLRGNNHSFEKVFNAIKLLPSAIDLRYDVVSCVNRRNLNELEQLRDLLIENEIKEWRIFTIFPIGRASENTDLQLEPHEFKALLEFIKKTRKDKKIQLNYGCEGYLGAYEKEVRDDFFMCRAGINVASVLANGDISACPNLRENFIQGNIYKDNFAEVWTKRYGLFRDRQWTKTGLCANCDSFKYCEGNGMHLRDEKTGELLFCHLKRLEDAESCR